MGQRTIVHPGAGQMLARPGCLSSWPANQGHLDSMSPESYFDGVMAIQVRSKCTYSYTNSYTHREMIKVCAAILLPHL